MTDQRDRIKALLALANHPNTPQHEAESALAMASRLMQRHGLNEEDVSHTFEDDHGQVVTQEIEIFGPYRVQRADIFWDIARIHSCPSYRESGYGSACVLSVWGRQQDIDAARTIFAAVDMLATRSLPKGERSWRISWFKGFRDGINESLSTAKREFAQEVPGAGLVLADRFTRANREMRSKVRGITAGYSYFQSSADARESGRNAGRSFAVSGRAFGSGVRGELK